EVKAKEGAHGLVRDKDELDSFLAQYATNGERRSMAPHRLPRLSSRDDSPVDESQKSSAAVWVGCDFGSTTAKAVVLSSERELLFSCYAQSNGNPIEDAKALFRQLRQAGFEKIAALALTGYGKDLLKEVIGSDL